MANYQGPAVLILPNGCEHQVQVRLGVSAPSPRGEQAWTGAMDADDDTAWQAFIGGDTCTLRLPGGSEAQVLFFNSSGRMTGVGKPPHW